MKQFVRRHKLSTVIVLTSGVLLIGIGWGWWHYIYSEPQRVFERMLTNSLSTPSVTKTTTDPNTSQSSVQTTQVTINPTPAVRSVNVVRQAGSEAETETIATPSDNYVRYNRIQTTQKDNDGNPLDFSSVLDVWASSTTLNSSADDGQVFSQNVLGVVPFARLSPDQRQTLLKQIKNDSVYNIDYSSVRRSIAGGRPTYSYEVGLKPRAYINMLKSFSKYLGPDELADVDISQFPDDQFVPLVISIDVWSGQLKHVAYSDEQRVETYSAQGAYNAITLPSNAISAQELQSKLQKIL